jgi:hypothetical protein
LERHGKDRIKSEEGKGQYRDALLAKIEIKNGKKSSFMDCPHVRKRGKHTFMPRRGGEVR